MKSIIIIGIIIAGIIGISASVVSSYNFDEPEPVEIEELEEPFCGEGVIYVDGICIEDHSVEYIPKVNCSGTAACITGIVSEIVDGDTIKVDDKPIRFALSSAPELVGYGGIDSKKFIETLCPVGSTVTVDEDDSQRDGSYGRMVGVVYCNGANLNSELLDASLGYLENQFCDSSEFAIESWAQKHGCSEYVSDTLDTQSNCDDSYPDFCIPSSPPDLDCGDISEKKFTVLQPDPHRFDADKDGIGCE